jgi:hypothetical protein
MQQTPDAVSYRYALDWFGATADAVYYYASHDCNAGRISYAALIAIVHHLAKAEEEQTCAKDPQYLQLLEKRTQILADYSATSLATVPKPEGSDAADLEIELAQLWRDRMGTYVELVGGTDTYDLYKGHPEAWKALVDVGSRELGVTLATEYRGGTR